MAPGNKNKGQKRRRTDSEISFFVAPPEVASTVPFNHSHRHIRLDNEDGRVSTSTSFFHAPASPVKAMPIPRWNDTVYEPNADEVDDGSPPPSLEPATDEGFVDPDYVSFLNDITLEPLPQPRRRPKSVTYSLSIITTSGQLTYNLYFHRTFH